jgi:uncharacterized membrane protein YczE
MLRHTCEYRAGVRISIRLGVYTIAIASVGVGVGLMVEADLGVAPNDVLNTGLSDTLGWQVGTAAWLTAAVAMLLAWILGRRPRVATVMGGVIVGLSINLVLAALPTPDPLWARIAFLVSGLVVVWFGITGVVAADVGAGPLELVMLAMMDRGIGVSVARWAIELTLLALGLMLGGAVGLGTAVFAVATGPVLAYTLPRATRVLGTDLRNPTEVAAAGP